MRVLEILKITIVNLVLVFFISCSNSSIDEKVTPHQKHESNTPEWLLGTWNADSIKIDYKDGRVENRITPLTWSIQDTIIEISVTGNFEYDFTGTKIELSLDGLNEGQKEVWNVERTDSAKITLTHQSLIDQILYMHKF